MEKDYHINQLPYTSQDEKWGIYCTSSGSLFLDKCNSHKDIFEKQPRHYFMDRNLGREVNEYQIVYITDGFGSYSSGDIRQSINSGTILLVFPNQRHRYFPECDSRWKEHWVGFRGEYPNILLKNGILDIRNPVLHIGYNQSILSSFSAIDDLAAKAGSNVQRDISIQIMRILSIIYETQNGERKDELHQHVIEKAKLFLYENLYNTLDIESMTRELSIGYKTLIELFKIHTDMTPYQYFLYLKIDKAKDLLAAGELSVKEISYRLEFQNQHYFSRLFKTKTGISPSQWGSVNTDQNDLLID